MQAQKGRADSSEVLKRRRKIPFRTSGQSLKEIVPHKVRIPPNI